MFKAMSLKDRVQLGCSTEIGRLEVPRSVSRQALCMTLGEREWTTRPKLNVPVIGLGYYQLAR